MHKIRSNCLLTKKTLLFVITSNGIYRKDINLAKLPQIISEHGYDVEILELEQITEEKINTYLNSQKKQFHLLIEGSKALPLARSMDLLDTLLDHVILLAERDYINDGHQERITDHSSLFKAIS